MKFHYMVTNKNITNILTKPLSRVRLNTSERELVSPRLMPLERGSHKFSHGRLCRWSSRCNVIGVLLVCSHAGYDERQKDTGALE